MSFFPSVAKLAILGLLPRSICFFMHGVVSHTIKNLIFQLQKSYLTKTNSCTRCLRLLTTTGSSTTSTSRSTPKHQPRVILHLRRVSFATAQEGENIASTSPCPLLPSLVSMSCRRSYRYRFGWMPPILTATHNWARSSWCS